MRIPSAVALLSLFFVGFPLSARAGWIVEWQNTSFKPNGERRNSELSTMHISKGQVRLVQPSSVSLIDYDKASFSVLNPAAKLFWSGPVDDYVAEASSNRQETVRSKFGPDAAANFRMPRIDEKELPAIVIRKLDEKQTIAGHEAVKHEIESRGQVFQELWLATDLDLSADLSVEKFLDYQRKMSASMLGKPAALFNALYRSAEYRKLLETGFVLRTVQRHNAGSFTREVASIRKADIAPAEFKVPEDYRRVALKDVLPAE